MTARPIILLDVDGVLADFIGGSLATLWELGVQRRREDVRSFDLVEALCLDDVERAVLEATWARAGWCASLPVYDGAAEGVELLRQTGDVYAVTAPMWSARSWESERRGWLIEQLGFRAKDVVSTHAKHLVAGDVLVDDRVSHLDAWTHGTPICWAQPYNEGFTGLRTNDWRAVAGAASLAAARRKRRR